MSGFVYREPVYPTPEHRRIVEGLTALLSSHRQVWAVVVEGSLGWGGATAASDVDVVAFVEPGALASVRSEDWQARYRGLGAEVSPVVGLRFGRLRADVDLTDGQLAPSGGLPRLDDYELAVGNLVAYAAVVYERDGRFGRWAAQYLPYFEEGWRRERMRLVWLDLGHNLRTVREMADRGLLLHGLERLLYAARYVVHYLFLQERKHALDWLKHLEWQAEHVLGLPALPGELGRVLALPELSAATLCRGAGELETLAARYLRPPPEGR